MEKWSKGQWSSESGSWMTSISLYNTRDHCPRTHSETQWSVLKMF